MSLVRTLFAGTVVTAFGASFLAGATGLAYLKSIAPSLPSLEKVQKWEPSEGVKILAADGAVMGAHASERRRFVPLGDIPKTLVDAFLAAEDGNYWRHSGVDPAGIARAAISNLRNRDTGRVEGGSTITQQVVKNLLLDSKQTLDRKLREAILALRLDRDVGKQRVIEVYLNEIYFGAGAYGVAEAARTYFGKLLPELTLAEAATLAGLPKAPSEASPFRNPARATERRNYVLGRMAEEGFISAAEAAAAKAAPMAAARQKAPAESVDPSLRYPEEAVRRMLVDRLGKDELYRDGGTVVTTIRPDMQKVVHASVRRGIVLEDRRSGWRGPLARGIRLPVDWGDKRLARPAGAEDWEVGVVSEVGRDAVVALPGRTVILKGQSMAWTGRAAASDLLRKGDAVLVGDLGRGPELVQLPEPEGIQAAAVVLDPASGDVLAMSGGFSHEISDFNRATQAKRQTGSAFKPFIYLAALEMGYDATSPVLDSPIAITPAPGQPDWRPKNSNDSGAGLITLRRALEQSRNLSTVRLMLDIGEDAMRSVTARVGLPFPKHFSPSVSLGTEGGTPLALAASYATIANGGRPVTPRFVRDEPRQPAEGVVDPVAAAQLTSILRGVVTNGTARRAFQGFGRPVAAKTGTTNESRDAWLVAYGPRFVVAVWIGREDNAPLHKGASGGGTAGPIARDILDKAPGIEFADFLLPEGVEEVRVMRDTGEPAENGDVVEVMRAGAARSAEGQEPAAEAGESPAERGMGIADEEGTED